MRAQASRLLSAANLAPVYSTTRPQPGSGRVLVQIQGLASAETAVQQVCMREGGGQAVSNTAACCTPGPARRGIARQAGGGAQARKTPWLRCSCRCVGCKQIWRNLQCKEACEASGVICSCRCASGQQLRRHLQHLGQGRVVALQERHPLELHLRQVTHSGLELWHPADMRLQHQQRLVQACDGACLRDAALTVGVNSPFEALKGSLSTQTIMLMDSCACHSRHKCHWAHGCKMLRLTWDEPAQACTGPCVPEAESTKLVTPATRAFLGAQLEDMGRGRTLRPASVPVLASSLSRLCLMAGLVHSSWKLPAMEREPARHTHALAERGAGQCGLRGGAAAWCSLCAAHVAVEHLSQTCTE